MRRTFKLSSAVARRGNLLARRAWGGSEFLYDFLKEDGRAARKLELGEERGCEGDREGIKLGKQPGFGWLFCVGEGVPIPRDCLWGGGRRIDWLACLSVGRGDASLGIGTRCSASSFMQPRLLRD